jgi:hypothetical protein
MLNQIQNNLSKIDVILNEKKSQLKLFDDNWENKLFSLKE